MRIDLRAAVTALALAALAADCTRVPTPLPAPVSLVPEQSQYAVMEASIHQLQASMASGQVTSAQLVRAYLRRIEAYDQAGPMLNTIIRLNPEAEAQADSLDAERKVKGPRGPLHGIPVVIKDNYDTKGLPTSAGAMALAGSLSSEDAFVVARLRAAGAVVLGKTNMTEFALGITTTSSITGQTRNPYDPARYPGGSSGGTAAAVAASFAAVGWGTDTCGSIRVPAAYNNLFALRPTKGLTSVQGIVPLCHSQDVSAPVARSVADLAIALDATVGLDPNDPASISWVQRPMPRFVAALDTAALKGARLGVVRGLFGRSSNEAAVTAQVNIALARMAHAGAQIIEVSLPGIDTLALRGSVIGFEFRDDLQGYLKKHPSAPVKSLSEIIARGLYLQELSGIYDSLNNAPGVGSSAYAAALGARDTLQHLLAAALAAHQLDALVFPTIRAQAGLIGDPQQDPNCELSANSGFPAISLPIGLTSGGTPVGIELLGAPMSDARLVALAYAWETAAAPRQAPTFTPHLALRSAPPPVFFVAEAKRDSVVGRVAFSFRPQTGELNYQLTVSGVDSSQVLAVSLHSAIFRTPVSADGPVVAPLGRPGRAKLMGKVVLDWAGRDALVAGMLYVTFQTVSNPSANMRAQLILPGALTPLIKPPI